MAESPEIVGMVIPDGTNQFFSSLAQLMQRHLQTRNKALIVTDSDGSVARERSYLSAFQDMDVAGVIFVSVGDNPGAYKLLREWQPPLLVLDREVPLLELEEADFVLTDSTHGVWQAVEYLQSLGHERIGFVSGAESTEPGRARHDAFRDACDQKGIPIDDALVLDGDFLFGSGREAADRYAEMNAVDRPTAVLAANDLMAVGLLQGFHETGLHVPGDVAIVGFDDIPLASWVYPRLTTVRQDALEMVRVGAQFLDDRIAVGNIEGNRTRVVAPRLVRRESCGPPSPP